MGEPPVRLVRAIKCSQSPDIVCAGDTGTQHDGHQCSLLQLLVCAHPECWEFTRIPLPQKSRLFSEVAKPQSALTAPGHTCFHGGEVAEVLGTPLGCPLLEDFMSPYRATYPLHAPFWRLLRAGRFYSCSHSSSCPFAEVKPSFLVCLLFPVAISHAGRYAMPFLPY